ncbi:MBL fold metallo-hydrolase [Desulfosediminicola flagellatus]|uniref:MBL fold metallo-hydrolase n=1 Tax=Desulfosediminicola flagellatus TaxID=2569541 RepID=UPI0010ABC7AD|nr:MBL fold metallo-hydrolase [Desulfosediminicola flagellatus]
MSIFLYTAQDLYTWLTSKQDMLLLDVRNSEDFKRFQVESPYDFDILNISYFDFMEIEDECVKQIPRDKPVRVVCASEGSAKFVAEILEKNGFDDIGYLEGGIKSWGNLLVPSLLNPGEDFELYQFNRPGKASCSYGVASGGEMMLFDPSRNIAFYQEFAKEKGCTLIRTCETHLQADYIAGSRSLMEATGIEVVANSHDFSGANFTYTPLEDKQLLKFSYDGPEVKVLFTPGHTPGSTSYLIDNRYLITGDTIFIKSVGRPDLGGQVDAWSDILFTTLQAIRKMDHSIQLLPGHYIDWSEANENLAIITSLGEAIDYNKAIHDIDNEADFLTFIKSNMREQPKEYATIRKINANLEQVDDDKADELDLGKNECAASAYAAEKG